jgi:diguanylate cyclase (GGDEF)-like protein/PAS domain S-box-containing protein
MPPPGSTPRREDGDRAHARRTDVAGNGPDDEIPSSEKGLLAGVIEATEAAIWDWDILRNTVTINERWASLIGYNADELQPVTVETFLGLIAPDDTAVVEEALNAHFAGKTANYDCEMRMRHRDGHWVWLQTRGRVLSWSEDGKPERMLGVHLTIEERKHQEERLRRSQELLEAAGRIAGVGGYEVDLVSGEIRWTDQTKRIHGVPLDYEPTLDAAIEFYAPEARPVIQSAIERAMDTGEGWDLELPMVRCDGQRIWVRAQGSVEMHSGRAVRIFGAFQDITQRRALTDALAEKNELLHVTLESIADAVITTDPQGLITWMNPVAEKLTGFALDEVRGKALEEAFRLACQQTRTPLANPVTACLQQREEVNLQREAVLLARDGSEYAIEDSAAPIINDEGTLLGAVMVFYDVTEQRRLSGEMSYRARHDTLTGLVNRSEFEGRLCNILGEARRNDVQHALLYLDLDQFKIVNDSCGHSAGDELLLQVTGLFKAAVRSRDTVARLGGDEFAIILERCPPPQAERIAQNICEQIRQQRFVRGEHGFRLGVSIGLVAVHGDWPSTSALMQAADTACYAAKEAGRDRVHRYQPDDAAIQTHQSRTRWALRIEQALEQDRFTLHGQRILPLGDDAGPERIELLVRLQEPEGLVMPGAFIPAAERFRLMTRIDRWVLEQSISLAAEGDQDAPTQLFVNLSGQSLGDRAFHQFVDDRLRNTAPAVRQRLVLEVTETEVIANLGDASAFLDAVRALGVKVALDDFGAGMASYCYLRNISFDYLKIDGQLVSSMLDDPLSLAAVRSFIEVAGVLDLTVVAEHVGCDETAATLQQMGVGLAQGFHLHRPEPIVDLLREPARRTTAATG